MKISCLPSTHNTLNSKQVNQKWIIYSSLCCSKPVWSSSAEHKRYFVQSWPSSNVDLNFMDTKPQWHNIFFCVRKRNSYFWVNSPFKTCRIIRHTQQAWTCLMYCHFAIELNHWIETVSHPTFVRRRFWSYTRLVEKDGDGDKQSFAFERGLITLWMCQFFLCLVSLPWGLMTHQNTSFLSV